MLILDLEYPMGIVPWNLSLLNLLNLVLECVHTTVFIYLLGARSLGSNFECTQL